MHAHERPAPLCLNYAQLRRNRIRGSFLCINQDLCTAGFRRRSLVSQFTFRVADNPLRKEHIPVTGPHGRNRWAAGSAKLFRVALRWGSVRTGYTLIESSRESTTNNCSSAPVISVSRTGFEGYRVDSRTVAAAGPAGQIRWEIVAVESSFGVRQTSGRTALRIESFESPASGRSAV
jgi:hypothetical protein